MNLRMEIGLVGEDCAWQKAMTDTHQTDCEQNVSTQKLIQRLEFKINVSFIASKE